MDKYERELIEMLVEQRDLSPEVVQATHLILSYANEEVSEKDASDLIRALSKAPDRDDVDYRVAGIIRG